METINNIELKDANIYPDEIVLNKVLGPSYPAYTFLPKMLGNRNPVYLK
jgi:hypothetical protein